MSFIREIYKPQPANEGLSCPFLPSIHREGVWAQALMDSWCVLKWRSLSLFIVFPLCLLNGRWAENWVSDSLPEEMAWQAFCPAVKALGVCGVIICSPILWKVQFRSSLISQEEEGPLTCMSRWDADTAPRCLYSLEHVHSTIYFIAGAPSQTQNPSHC